MKFGVYLPNFGPFGDARTLANLAQDAEQAGWDGFFIWDHIARPWVTNLVDPWVALTAMAMTTKTIRIGALVTPLPRRRPWKVARETVSLDRLSGGRLIFGVGIGSRGGKAVEWANFAEQMNLKVRAEMLDEGLKIITGLWTGEPFAYDGRHFQVKESHFVPTPAQSPRIPIWVAGYWPNKRPFRRAARWDGMIPLPRSKEVGDLTHLKAVIDYTQQQRDNDGPYDIVHIAVPTPGDEPLKAAELVAPYAAAGATWWLEQFNPPHFGGSWQGDWPLDAMHQRILQGPPAIG